MKFNFNKKIVSTIVILIFGVAITVVALSAKNIALENKTSSEIATEAVSATEMILDTENTETSNVDKNSSDSSKDKATVVDDKDKSGDTKSSSENTYNNDSRNSYETDIMKNDDGSKQKIIQTVQNILEIRQNFLLNSQLKGLQRLQATINYPQTNRLSQKLLLTG